MDTEGGERRKHERGAIPAIGASKSQSALVLTLVRCFHMHLSCTLDYGAFNHGLDRI